MMYFSVADDDQLLTEAELAKWLTVLNHGEEPSAEDMKETVDSLDEWRDILGAPPVTDPTGVQIEFAGAAPHWRAHRALPRRLLCTCC